MKSGMAYSLHFPVRTHNGARTAHTHTTLKCDENRSIYLYFNPAPGTLYIVYLRV